MSEEEKKAIKNIEDILNQEDLVSITLYGVSINNIRTILNLTEKQDKEIEIKDKMIDLMAKAINNYDTQLVISKYKSKEDVIQKFKEWAEEGGKENG